MDTVNPSASMGFHEVDHTADWAYRVWADSLENLFKQAAAGLYHLAGMTLTAVPPSRHQISLQAVDEESLLVAWLNELLYLHEAHNLGAEAIPQFRLDKTSSQATSLQATSLPATSLPATSLQATVVARPVQRWVKDIKAVTYNNLAISSTDQGLEVTLVLDV